MFERLYVATKILDRRRVDVRDLLKVDAASDNGEGLNAKPSPLEGVVGESSNGLVLDSL